MSVAVKTRAVAEGMCNGAAVTDHDAECQECDAQSIANHGVPPSAAKVRSASERTVRDELTQHAPLTLVEHFVNGCERVPQLAREPFDDGPRFRQALFECGTIEHVAAEQRSDPLARFAELTLDRASAIACRVEDGDDRLFLTWRRIEPDEQLTQQVALPGVVTVERVAKGAP
jgi:hypothetical protein